MALQIRQMNIKAEIDAPKDSKTKFCGECNIDYALLIEECVNRTLERIREEKER